MLVCAHWVEQLFLQHIPRSDESHLFNVGWLQGVLALLDDLCPVAEKVTLSIRVVLIPGYSSWSEGQRTHKSEESIAPAINCIHVHTQPYDDRVSKRCLLPDIEDDRAKFMSVRYDDGELLGMLLVACANCVGSCMIC